MAVENTTSTLDGYFKEVYGNIEDALPNFAMLSDSIEFRQSEKLGDSYHFPVQLTREHGWSFAGGANAGTAFSLNEAEAAVSKDAQVQSTEAVGRSKLSYGAASKAQSSGAAAFANSTETLVTNLQESGYFYLELMMLYGGRGIAKISAVSGSGTTRTWTISDDTWAPAVWSQMVNGYLDAYNDEALTTKQNSNADIQVTSVDVANKQIVVSGNATDLSAIAADEWLCPRDWDGNTFTGIIGHLANTGTLHNIAAGTYPLWKTTAYSSGSAALTLGKVNAAILNAVGQGLMEDLDFYMSVETWLDLNTDHATLRRFAESTKSKLDIGTKAIEYHSVNGTIRLRPHPMLYAGRAFGITPRRWKRPGSSNLTFRLPNSNNDRFFRELQSSAGFEIRCWFDLGLVCTRPAQQVYVTNITNASAN